MINSNQTIQGLILDIDGVLVGDKVGINSPTPHPDVINALRWIKKKGIFISLCTAKPAWAINDIIEQAELSNYHITDGGAVIVDPTKGSIIHKHVIDSSVSTDVTQFLIDHNYYTEVYTTDGYYIQENQKNDLTYVHSQILQKEPSKLHSLADYVRTHEIVKIMPIVPDEMQKEQFQLVFSSFQTRVSLKWAVHPIALPAQFGAITAPGVTKKIGASQIVEHEHVSFDQILAVGDSSSDWDFIKPCGFGGAMGNAQEKLKENVRRKQHGFIGASVDDNGILDIFTHFGLL